MELSILAPPSLSWSSSSCFPALGETDVHVWAVPLDVATATLSTLAAWLSPAELKQAARFHFEQHRNRFIAARGHLRIALGAYLEANPAAIAFDFGPQGKPALGGSFAHAGLHFNLSHSGDLALLAVTRLAPVGIDLEQVRALPDAQQLVARFFSARENHDFCSLPVEQQPAAFFNLWTRKEAWLKATGEGIGHLLSKVEVSFLPGQPARLLSLPEGAAADELTAGGWHLQDLAPAPGFAAALAIQAERAQIHNWRFPAAQDLSVQPELDGNPN